MLKMHLGTEVEVGCVRLWPSWKMWPLFELTLRNKLSSVFSDGELELTDQCLASGFLVSDTTDSWL